MDPSAKSNPAVTTAAAAQNAGLATAFMSTTSGRARSRPARASRSTTICGPPYDGVMPLITVRMTPGRTAAQKAELVSRLTDVFLETCGNPGQRRQGVWVVLDEVPGENWAVGGEMLRKDDPADS